MTKIGLKKELKQFYNPPKEEISVVDVPAMNFIMIDHLLLRLQFR